MIHNLLSNQTLSNQPTPLVKRFSPMSGVGEDLSTASTYEEAMRMSKLGFTPIQKKMQTLTGEPRLGHKVLYNSITGEQLSVVKDEYTVISNEEAFNTAEDLVEQEGFTFQTSNIQKGGARCRLILSGPEAIIAGEKYTSYAIFNNSFDLSKSVSIQFMFMRLACLNGLMRKAPHCNSSISLAHFGQKETKLSRLSKFKTKFSKTLSYLQKEAELLRSTKLTRQEFIDEIIPIVVSHTFQRPITAKLTPQQGTRTQAYIMSILAAYDEIDTINYNDTALKVQLALSDTDSHLAPFVNRKNRADLYLDRITQNNTIMSTANMATNYIIKSRKLEVA